MAETRRQLRSGTVVLGGMGLLAAALTACSDDPDKRCVDRDSYNAAKGYKVVSDKDCKSGSSGTRKSKTRKTTGSDAAWYYGGDESKGWVDGGSFSSKSGGSGGSSGGSGVSRGGFGDGDGSSGG